MSPRFAIVVMSRTDCGFGWQGAAIASVSSLNGVVRKWTALGMAPDGEPAPVAAIDTTPIAATGSSSGNASRLGTLGNIQTSLPRTLGGRATRPDCEDARLIVMVKRR